MHVQIRIWDTFQIHMLCTCQKRCSKKSIPTVDDVWLNRHARFDGGQVCRQYHLYIQHNTYYLIVSKYTHSVSEDYCGQRPPKLASPSDEIFWFNWKARLRPGCPGLRRAKAERGGFEPPVPVSQYDGLANRWFQPLTHLSWWGFLILFFHSSLLKSFLTTV